MRGPFTISRQFNLLGIQQGRILVPKASRFPYGLLAVLATCAVLTGLALAQRPADNARPMATTNQPRFPRQASATPASPSFQYPRPPIPAPPTNPSERQTPVSSWPPSSTIADPPVANRADLQRAVDVDPRIRQPRGDAVPHAGGPPNGTTFPQNPSQPEAAPEVFELGKTVAIVGDEHILRGDLVSEANIILIPHLEKLSEEERATAEPQIAASREKLVKQALQEAVQRKMLYTMFLRTIPPDKLEEAMANLKDRVAEQFSEQLDKMIDKLREADKEDFQSLARQNSQLFRLALLMKELNLTTQRELDLVLRRYGSSLEKQHEIFGEDQLGRQTMYQEARDVAEVTYDDMVAYYQEYQEDFEVPTRAKWEQVTVSFDSFSTKAECGQEIARLGNELFYGAPFAKIAKRHSDGPNAEKGGLHDWTPWGDFSISREINEAVFSLPTGKLSHIIEDHEGLHIIRVIEREEAHVVPFVEAQSKIKDEIRSKRRSKSIKAYLTDLRDQIPVWTIYDDPEKSEQIAQPRGTDTPQY